jgi:methyl-accepting chemotaxis protein
MNPLLFPPTLIKRALDDLGAIADAARRLPALEEQVIERIDRVEREAISRVDTIIVELAALRAELAPIAQLDQVREGIAPLDADMRAVRDSVDELEPLLRDVNERLEAMRTDLAPVGELADKIPGIGS